MYQFGKTSLASLEGILPKLVEVLTKAIATSPYDFTITDGVRTAAEQHKLWLQGRNEAGQIVKYGSIVTMRDGYKLKSNHQPKSDGFGYAVDLYPYVNGKVDFADKGNRLPTIARHIQSIGAQYGLKIIWGGDWTIAKDGLIDRPHFEVK